MEVVIIHSNNKIKIRTLQAVTCKWKGSGKAAGMGKKAEKGKEGGNREWKGGGGEKGRNSLNKDKAWADSGKSGTGEHRVPGLAGSSIVSPKEERLGP